MDELNCMASLASLHMICGELCEGGGGKGKRKDEQAIYRRNRCQQTSTKVLKLAAGYCDSNATKNNSLKASEWMFEDMSIFKNKAGSLGLLEISRNVCQNMMQARGLLFLAW